MALKHTGIHRMFTLYQILFQGLYMNYVIPGSFVDIVLSSSLKGVEAVRSEMNFLVITPLIDWKSQDVSLVGGWMPSLTGSV